MNNSTDGLDALAAYELAKGRRSILPTDNNCTSPPWDKCGCGSATCPVNLEHAKQLSAEQAIIERRDARQPAQRKLRCYYAHCLAIYNTRMEERDVRLIERLGFEVLNPNCQRIKDEFAAYKTRNPDDYMQYFEGVVMGCDVLAFRALPDGAIPAGVEKEVRWALGMGKPVIELPGALTRRTLSVHATRDYLYEIGQR
jgi:hypothetical protein